MTAAMIGNWKSLSNVWDPLELDNLVNDTDALPLGVATDDQTKQGSSELSLLWASRKRARLYLTVIHH
jgi:hypothetical protein